MSYRAFGLKASSAASSLRRSSTLDACRRALMCQQRLFIFLSVENPTNTFTTVHRRPGGYCHHRPDRLCRRNRHHGTDRRCRMHRRPRGSLLPPGSSFYQHESALIERIALVSTTRKQKHFCTTESTSLRLEGCARAGGGGAAWRVGKIFKLERLCCRGHHHRQLQWQENLSCTYLKFTSLISSPTQVCVQPSIMDTRNRAIYRP
jgi:hypothetical protein